MLGASRAGKKVQAHIVMRNNTIPNGEASTVEQMIAVGLNNDLNTGSGEVSEKSTHLRLCRRMKMRLRAIDDDRLPIFGA